MRARPLALVIAGFLASTSAVGIALFNSQQEPTEEVRPEADTGSGMHADDTATLAASAGASRSSLQTDESLLDAVQVFDTTHGAWRFSMPDLGWPTSQPLSVDMGLAHVQGGSASGTGSPGFTNSLHGLSVGFATSSGGGTSRHDGINSNPETGTDGVDEPTDEVGEDEPPKDPESPQAPQTPSQPIEPPPFVPDPEVDGAVSVPEPGTLGLIGVGLIGLLLGRRRPARRS